MVADNTKPYEFTEFSYFKVHNLLTPKLVTVNHATGAISNGGDSDGGDAYFLMTGTLRTDSQKFKGLGDIVVSFITDGDAWYKIVLLAPGQAPNIELAAVRQSGGIPIFVNMWLYADFYMSRMSKVGGWTAVGPEAFGSSTSDEWLVFWKLRPGMDNMFRQLAFEQWFDKDDQEVIKERINAFIEQVEHPPMGELP